MKATVEEIRQRFDADVERFANLETGQSATVDAPLALALVAGAAAATTPQARHVLDVGCGAGNYTLKLLEFLPNLDATLIDLSQPMLDRARERGSRATTRRITTIQADIREVEPHVFDGKTVVLSPHKVYGSSTNDLCMSICCGR